MPDLPLYLEKKKNIGWLILNRPGRKNALDMDMWQRIPSLLREAQGDEDIHLLVIKSSTKDIFCAGADISEFEHFIKDPDKRRQNTRALRAACKSLEEFPKPTMAMIEGDCVGGGCMLALCCDLRLSHNKARFGITPAKLGLVYGLSDTRRLVKLVGPSEAKSLLFSARLISAAHAHHIGLVNEIFPAEDLQNKILHMARLMSENSPHSLRQMKKMIRRVEEGAHEDDDLSEEIFDQAFNGPDHLEGINAFLNKRKPLFRPK